MTRRAATITRAWPAYREIDDRWGIARVLTDLANVDLQAEDYAQADGSLKEALRAFRELGHQRGVARQLESLSWCASCQSRDEQAVALASAAAAIRQQIAAPAEPAERERIERALAQARQRISPEAVRERVGPRPHHAARFAARDRPRLKHRGTAGSRVRGLASGSDRPFPPVK